jgi:hypothetical protein
MAGTHALPPHEVGDDLGNSQIALVLRVMTHHPALVSCLFTR